MSVHGPGDLASRDWWERRQEVAPAASPPDNLQQVLDDVFEVQGSQGLAGGPAGNESPQAAASQLHCPKTGPPDSLLVRQACPLSCHATLVITADRSQEQPCRLNLPGSEPAQEGYPRAGRFKPVRKI